MNDLHYVSPDEAVRLVKSGDTIVVQGSTSIPQELLRALTRRAHELRDVKIISGFGIAAEDAPYAKKEYIDSFRALNIFVPNCLRKRVLLIQSLVSWGRCRACSEAVLCQ